MRLRLAAAGGEPLDIDGGKIVETGGAPDLALDLGDASLRPGLVNAHDHLHRNHVPRLGSPPYRDMYAWGEDLHAKNAGALEKRSELPRRSALLFGALKNVLGGATTVVHHDPWEVDFEDDFPIRVPKIRSIQSVRDPKGTAWTGGPVAIHLCEGTGAHVAAEVEEVAARGLLDERLLAVHLVGVDASGIDRLERAGCAAVWCPTSNAFLYGRTAPGDVLSRLDVLLGTDSLATGDGTLLHELHAARSLWVLDDGRLEAAVSSIAARRLGLLPPSLFPGAPADVIALRRPLLEARPRDVALVLVAGRPVFADERLAAVFEAAGLAHEPLEVGGAKKRVVAPLGTIAAEVFALTPEARRILD